MNLKDILNELENNSLSLRDKGAKFELLIKNWFLTTGLCGGFTIFSTFSLETVELIEKNQFILASLYSLGSIVLSVVGIYIGYYLAKLF